MESTFVAESDAFMRIIRFKLSVVVSSASELGGRGGGLSYGSNFAIVRVLGIIADLGPVKHGGTNRRSVSWANNRLDRVEFAIDEILASLGFNLTRSPAVQPGRICPPSLSLCP